MSEGGREGERIGRERRNKKDEKEEEENREGSDGGKEEGRDIIINTQQYHITGCFHNCPTNLTLWYLCGSV